MSSDKDGTGSPAPSPGVAGAASNHRAEPADGRGVSKVVARVGPARAGDGLTHRQALVLAKRRAAVAHDRRQQWDKAMGQDDAPHSGREGWMTSLPEGHRSNPMDDLIGGGKAKFNRRQGRLTVDQTWAASPSEKARPLPTVAAQEKPDISTRMRIEEAKKRALMDEYNSKHRPKSLVEIHMEKREAELRGDTGKDRKKKKKKKGKKKGKKDKKADKGRKKSDKKSASRKRYDTSNSSDDSSADHGRSRKRHRHRRRRSSSASWSSSGSSYDSDDSYSSSPRSSRGKSSRKSKKGKKGKGSHKESKQRKKSRKKDSSRGKRKVDPANMDVGGVLRWDRDRDITGGSKLDARSKLQMLAKARDLGSRFSHSTYKS